MLKECREKKGLSQEDLAEKAQVPVELIRVMEEGQTVHLPTFQAVAISEALGVEPSSIFTADMEKVEELEDKLENYECVCMESAEQLESLANTLCEARVHLPQTVEYCMIETVEIALEAISRNLKKAPD